MLTSTGSVLSHEQLIEKAFSLFPNVKDFSDLNKAYLAYHRQLSLEGLWDPRNEESKFQELMAYLRDMDPAKLIMVIEYELRKEILWAGYTHAFEYVLWLNADMSLQERSALAHQYVSEICNIAWFQDRVEQDEQNKLAHVWSFIVDDDLDDLRHWVDTLVFRHHSTTAHELIGIYERNRATAPKILSQIELATSVA